MTKNPAIRFLKKNTSYRFVSFCRRRRCAFFFLETSRMSEKSVFAYGCHTHKTSGSPLEQFFFKIEKKNTIVALFRYFCECARSARTSESKINFDDACGKWKSVRIKVFFFFFFKPRQSPSSHASVVWYWLHGKGSRRYSQQISLPLPVANGNCRKILFLVRSEFENRASLIRPENSCIFRTKTHHQRPRKYINVLFL